MLKIKNRLFRQHKGKKVVADLKLIHNIIKHRPHQKEITCFESLPKKSKYVVSDMNSSDISSNTNEEGTEFKLDHDITSHLQRQQKSPVF